MSIPTTLQNPLVEPLLARGLNCSSAEPNVKNENEESVLTPLLRERIEHSMRSIVSVLGEGSTLWVNSRLLSFRRPRPKVGAPVFTYPRPLWEREKPCEQSELRIRVRGNLRTLSAIGINQLDSRAAHENDDLQPTPHPNPVPLGRNIRKGGLKNA